MMRSKDVKVGDTVCDCRYRHLQVLAIEGDDLWLSGGSVASAQHCCSPVPHPEWAHPTNDELRAWALAEVEKMSEADRAKLDPIWLAEILEA